MTNGKKILELDYQEGVHSQAAKKSTIRFGQCTKGAILAVTPQVTTDI